jgi:hypothetical protein
LTAASAYCYDPGGEGGYADCAGGYAYFDQKLSGIGSIYKSLDFWAKGSRWYAVQDGVTLDLTSLGTNGTWTHYCTNLSDPFNESTFKFRWGVASENGGTEEDGYCDNAYAYFDDIHFSTVPCNETELDLSISSDNISFSPYIPKKGATGNISALINNTGYSDAENVTIRFYEGCNGTGELIGEVNVSQIPVNGNATVQVQWTPAEAGPCNITVVVDPDNTISETDEDNNQAYKNVTVATYRVLVVGTYYGDEDDSIREIEINVNMTLNEVVDYYKIQSYETDYIGFSAPIYINLTKSVDEYQSRGGQKDSWYGPPDEYADDVCSEIRIRNFSRSEYDAILAHQSDKAWKYFKGDNSTFRAYAIPTTLCGRIACVSLWADFTFGTFSHELGHALYGFKDLYYDVEKTNRGSIGDWGLMGSGYDLSPLAPLISFDKEEARWVSYNYTVALGLGLQPKEFQITLLDKIGFNGTVPKITLAPSNQTPFGVIPYGCYDYLLEARNDSGRSGIVIYQDKNWTMYQPNDTPFLESLKPLTGDRSLATLNNDSSLYQSPITGLKFMCLNENCDLDSQFKTKVIVGYNVSDYSNGKVAISRLKIQQVNSSNSSSSTLPLGPNFRRFGEVVPLNTSVTDDGHFKSYFVNLFNGTIEIISVNVSGTSFSLPWKKNCSIITPLPLNVSSKGVFSIETDGCVSPVLPRSNTIVSTIDISLIVFMQNGLAENKTIKGSMYVIFNTESLPYNTSYRWNTLYENGEIKPVPHEEFQGLYIINEDGDVVPFGNVTNVVNPEPADYSWIYPVIFLIFWLALAVVFRKNKRALLVLVAVLLFLILAGLFIIYQEYSRMAGINDLAAPVVAYSSSGSASSVENLSAPNANLHAYDNLGRHVGMNYSSGVFENQIPGSIASGDMFGEQWIFIPEGVNASFVVDGHDISEYLNETNSSENLSLNYSFQFMQYGPNPSVAVENGTVVISDRSVSEPINGSIGPGEEQEYALSTTTTTTTTSTTTTLANCSSGGVGICGANFCCGATDNVCPTDFEGVSCGVQDPDCSCSYGGVSICGAKYCCGVSDGVCPSSFEGVLCSTFDVDCS